MRTCAANGGIQIVYIKFLTHKEICIYQIQIWRAKSKEIAHTYVANDIYISGKHTHTHTHKCAHTHAHTRTCTHAHAHTYIHTHTAHDGMQTLEDEKQSKMRAHTRTYTHIHTQTHTQTHTHSK